jgi:CheY-like chemotaxis protein
MLDDSFSDEPFIVVELNGEHTVTPLEPAAGSGRPLALVADDDSTTRIFVSRVLTNCGVEVIEATNGKQALDLYELHHGAISLVVLDVIMPVMGGEHVLAEIRTTDSATPILMVSGDVDLEQREQLLASGATAFLTKPLDTITLAITVRQLLPALESARR